VRFLVDANVVSEAVRKVPDGKVLRWLEAHDADLCFSVITLGEIEKGVLGLADGKRRRQLTDWYRELRLAMEGRILVFGEVEAGAWAVYSARHRSRGRVIPSIDGMLAGTAIVHGLTIATRNTVDFPEVAVVDPWADPGPLVS
jgi:predicted nucleic acid-binding protein